MTTAKTIDIHAHAVLEETMGAAGRFGPELGGDDANPWFRVGEYRLDGVRYRNSPFMDVVRRLSAMDAAGIDLQVLSPNPLTYFHHIDAADAIRFCAQHNDALAALVARYPDRLAGFAALPMQDPAAAVDELQRAVRTLQLLGAYIGTDFPHALDSPALDPLYAQCVALDVPLFLHPAPAGIDGPPGDAKLQRFDLDLVVGFAAQETLATATLIYGGVLDRHPQLDVCISHGGGAAAFLVGRLAAASRQRPWSPAFLHVDGAFEERLARQWYDCHVHDRRALDLLIANVGAERLVLGTNFAGWDQPKDVRRLPLAETVDLGANARRLLRLGRA